MSSQIKKKEVSSYFQRKLCPKIIVTYIQKLHHLVHTNVPVHRDVCVTWYSGAFNVFVNMQFKYKLANKEIYCLYVCFLNFNRYMVFLASFIWKLLKKSPFKFTVTLFENYYIISMFSYFFHLLIQTRSTCLLTIPTVYYTQLEITHIL